MGTSLLHYLIVVTWHLSYQYPDTQSIECGKLVRNSCSLVEDVVITLRNIIVTYHPNGQYLIRKVGMAPSGEEIVGGMTEELTLTGALP